MTDLLASVRDHELSGLSAAETARALGITYTKLRVAIRDQAVPFPSGRAKRYRAIRESMAACAAAGLTRRETAAKLGVKLHCITNAVRDHGFVFAPGRRRKIAP